MSHTVSLLPGDDNHSSEQCRCTVQEVQVSTDEEPPQYVPTACRSGPRGGLLAYSHLLFLCSGSDGRGVLLCEGLYQSFEVSHIASHSQVSDCLIMKLEVYIEGFAVTVSVYIKFQLWYFLKAPLLA